MATTQDVFSAAATQYEIANSQADLATAKQASDDSKVVATDALRAISAKSATPPTGGGQFGPLNSPRGNLNLGALGGLATATRAGINAATKSANKVTRDATEVGSIQATNPGITRENAYATLTPEGFVTPSTIPGQTRIIRYDDSGQGSITYR